MTDKETKQEQTKEGDKEKNNTSSKEAKSKTTLAAILVVLVVLAAAAYIFTSKKDIFMFMWQNNQAQQVDIPELTNDLKELRKIIIEEGQGREIRKGDYAYVVYAGFLPDGTLFDTNVNTKQAIGFQIGVGQVIEGWDKGLLGVKEGSEVILDIPAHMAYGEKGYGPIPPNSALRFDIKVVKVLSPEEAAALQKEMMEKMQAESNTNPETDTNNENTTN